MAKENVITVINQKGGVGKTTLSFSVATAASRAGRRVLLLDIDPQASLTTWIMGDEEPSWSTFDIFRPKPESGTSPTAVQISDTLDFLPSSLDLSVADMIIAGRTRREFILRNFLSRIKEQYDMIILDCPPTLGGITTNALAATDHLLVPTTAETMSIKGISILENVIDEYHSSDVMKPSTIEGIVLTMYQPFISHQKNNAASLRLKYGDAVFNTEIRKGTVASEAAGAGMDIYTYTKERHRDPRISDDLTRLTEEIIEKYNL